MNSSVGSIPTMDPEIIPTISHMNLTDHHTDLIFGSVELISSTFGLFLNALTIPYFFTKRRQATYFVYLSIGK